MVGTMQTFQPCSIRLLKVNIVVVVGGVLDKVQIWHIKRLVNPTWHWDKSVF